VIKRERDRVRRHAAVIAVAQRSTPGEDDEAGRWDALRRWRGDEACAIPSDASAWLSDSDVVANRANPVLRPRRNLASQLESIANFDD
jgi:hypothetical protein